MTLSKSIDTLLSSNVEPSEEEARKIRRLLVEPTHQLEELENEIRRLETQLDDLKAKRTKTKATISRYRAVLSPIRRLPADILREIFIYCLEEHRNPAMLASEAPMLLTRICSPWRSIAHSSPLLWAQIHIVFPNWIQFPDIEDSNDGENIPISQRQNLVSNELFQQLRHEAVAEWLSRSGSCPLSISLHYATSFIDAEYPAFRPKSFKVIKSLFEVLANEANRWRNIELSIPKDAYSTLVEALDGSHPSKLVTLRVSFTPESGGSWFSVPSDIDFAIGPTLKKLSVDDVRRFPSGRSHFGMQTLTSLSIHSQLSTNDAASILKNCPLLTHLKLTILSWSQNSSETMPTIHLPGLCTLYINDQSSNLLSTVGFYDAFYSPKLATFSFYSSSVGFYPNMSPVNTTKCPITPITGLLLKSTRLQTLMLCLDNFSNKQISEILQSANSITHLIYGTLTPHSCSSIYPQLWYCETKWDFKSTFFQLAGNSDIGSISSTITLPLLPKLEKIEFLDSARVRELSNNTLLQFIISRIDPWPSTLISSLKEVKVNFNFHPKNKAVINVKEGILKYTREIGIASNIKVNLTYSEYDYSPFCVLGMCSEKWAQDRIDEDVGYPLI